MAPPTTLLPVRAVDPLNHAVPIVDREGKPTPHFLRQWVMSRVVNLTVGDTTVAVDELRTLITSAQAALTALEAALDSLEGTVSDQGDDITDLQGDAVVAGTGLSFSGTTLNLDDTAVTPGTYGDASHYPQVTVDQQGRITSISEIALPV